MAIRTVVTRGFGSWGSVNKLPTRGYGGTATPITGFGRLEYAMPNARLEYVLSPERLEFRLPDARPEYTLERP